jgi:hypothetical protein
MPDYFKRDKDDGVAVFCNVIGEGHGMRFRRTTLSTLTSIVLVASPVAAGVPNGSKLATPAWLIQPIVGLPCSASFSFAGEPDSIRAFGFSCKQSGPNTWFGNVWYAQSVLNIRSTRCPSGKKYHTRQGPRCLVSLVRACSLTSDPKKGSPTGVPVGRPGGCSVLEGSQRYSPYR